MCTVTQPVKLRLCCEAPLPSPLPPPPAPSNHIASLGTREESGIGSKFLHRTHLSPCLEARRPSSIFLGAASSLAHFFPLCGHPKTARAISQS